MTDTRQPELSLARFEQLVESYGGDIDRFPLRERAAAKALVLRSPEARRVLDAARALDALLASARERVPSPKLEAALAAIPDRYPQDRLDAVTLLPFRSRVMAALAAAAALALGIWSGGTTSGDENDELVEQAEVASVAFGDELFLELSAYDALEGVEP